MNKKQKHLKYKDAINQGSYYPTEVIVYLAYSLLNLDSCLSSAHP